MITLMKSTFYKEEQTKEELCNFIKSTDRLSMGKTCKAFEEAFSKYQGRKYSVLFNSGSSANLALIQSLINGGALVKGDHVGFSALTWATNVYPLIQLGLEPVPIDVSLETLNINSENLEGYLESGNIKALFLTNALGLSGDIVNIQKICKQKGIILLEDNCESLGSEVNGIKLGNFGVASTFSFFVGHHLSTIEGGMVCTDSHDLYNELLLARAHGWDRHLDEKTQSDLRTKNNVDEFYGKYTFYKPGYNLRPTEITGFLGLSQLKYVDEMNLKRNKNYKTFLMSASKNKEIFSLNDKSLNFISNFAFPLVFKDKKSYVLYRELFSKYAEIRPIIGGSIIEQPFFKEFVKNKSKTYSCPNAQKINECGFYFPNNAELTDSEVETLCNLIEGMKGDIYKPKISNSKMKKALITGVTGQDGSYLAEFLLEKGYEVHGVVRRASSFNRERLKDIYSSKQVKHSNFSLHYGDMTDSSSILKILSEVKPDEIYNLAAQSHVRISFEVPEYTAEVDALGVLKLLEAIRSLNIKPRIYQASTSELYGKVLETPQRETTPFYPRSPYGTAKLYAYWVSKNYREAHNIFICNGILFNHESPRRGENFVSRKITLGVAAIKLGKKSKISLGNLEAKRDWGYAKDYVESMWMMLQQENPDDYVIATGKNYSVREFVESAFEEVGIKIDWKGEGINEKGLNSETGDVVIDIDPSYFRPSEVDFLLGDPSKANKLLGWKSKTQFKELVSLMVKEDIKKLSSSCMS